MKQDTEEKLQKMITSLLQRAHIDYELLKETEKAAFIRFLTYMSFGILGRSQWSQDLKPNTVSEIQALLMTAINIGHYACKIDYVNNEFVKHEIILDDYKNNIKSNND